MGYSRKIDAMGVPKHIVVTIQRVISHPDEIFGTLGRVVPFPCYDFGQWRKNV
jgi:hypothetical protein